MEQPLRLSLVDAVDEALRLVLPDNYANTLTLIIIQAIISWLEEDGTDEEKAATIRSLKAAVHNYQLAA